MKSFFQRFHDSQPATSKSSRTKDAAYKQWMSSSKPEKHRPQPSNGAEHPTEYHTTHAASPRPSDDSTADSHGHVATGYSTRYSTFPGSSTNRHLLPNPSRSHTYPLDSPVNEQKGLSQNDASRPPAGRNEPPELSSHDGHIAFRVKTERPSQSHPLSPSPPTQQQHQVWLPEVQVEPKEKRRQRERRYINEDEGVALRPQQKPDSPDSERGGTRRHYGNDLGVEANNHRRSDQKEKELNSKEYHRYQASGVVKETQQWERQVKDMDQLRERENRKKERLKLRREREDAEDKEKTRAKEKLEQDRTRLKQGTSEKWEEKEKTRRDEWDQGREDDRRFREERHQRRELQKEKEARERQIQLEQKDINARRDREREAKDEQDRERRAKDERERERRERKARERHVERERLAAREQTEKEYGGKFERERQERQKQKERDQQEKQDPELERRELEIVQRDRITQKQLMPRKDQDLRQHESKPKEIDMLRADRERQDRRKKDRQLWEQQREREREERERRRRGDQVLQIPEPNLSETGVDRVSVRSKKRVREGVSDSEREQWHILASDRLTSRVSTQANELTETEDGTSAPNADPPRRLDCADEPSEPQPFSKPALRSNEDTLKVSFTLYVCGDRSMSRV
jgi:hypothetical protein